MSRPRGRPGRAAGRANEQRLQAAVTELRAQVQWLLARVDEPELAAPAVPGPAGWCWRELPREPARARWGRLVDWVGWLAARYGIDDVIPACWYLHPPLVEELTALYAGWDAAYRAGDPNPAGWDPLSWHEALERSLLRLREWDRRGCRDGGHRPDLPAVTDLDGAAARAAGPPTTHQAASAAAAG
jgi:hypothetical protein